MSEPSETRVTLDSRIDADNPWPGLRSYDEEEQDFFHGRPREGVQLLQLVKRDVLTVLFGISGIGKTSLLKAGLFPLLRDEGYLPVRVRLDFADPQLDLVGGVIATLENEVKGRGLQIEWIGQPYSETDKETLWEYLHRLRIWAHADPLTPVLVFDQFEEIFTLGATPHAAEAARGFCRELADLVENQIPPDLLQKIERTHQLPSFPTDQQACRVLLALREDYLANLESLIPLIPSLAKRNRYRLFPMTSEQAQEAVLKPGGHLVSQPVAEKIIQSIASPMRGYRLLDLVGDEDTGGAKTLQAEVEPFLLSLVCRELNNSRQQRKLPAISAELVQGSQSEILSAFYERCFVGIPHVVRVWVEDHLVGDSGYRDMVALERALKQKGMTRKAIDSLVDRRLLRIEEDRNGIPRIELTHDVLTKLATKSRGERLTRTEIRRSRFAVWSLSILTVGVIGFAFWQWRHAEGTMQMAMEWKDEQSQRLEAIIKQSSSQNSVEVAQTAYADLKRSAEPAPPDNPAVPSAGLIYIQIRDDAQKASVLRLQAALQKMGFIVPAIQTLATGPDNNEVRYFRPEDAPKAEKIVALLQAENIGSVAAKLIPGFAKSKRILTNQFEIWFTPDAFLQRSEGTPPLRR